MRKKCLRIITILTILVQIIGTRFSYVEARRNDNQQPATCNWPSGMMTKYFEFQNEAKKILLWSNINSMRYSSAFGDGWVFSNQVLWLKWTSAIDLIAANVAWNIGSFVSNVTTSVFLFELTAESVLQSNIEWFAILFQDRPIVRDYKKMLDIETELFDVAYFRSKQVDLNTAKDPELQKNFNELIKKYQKAWLLEAWNGVENVSLREIIFDLVSMNTSMKHFIMLWWNLWKSGLRNYNWCLWKLEKCENQYWWNYCCTRSVATLKFSDNAIDELYNAYKDVRSFGACNSNAAFFKNSVNKTINNNKESVKTAVNDVKEAIKRLKWALVGEWRWNMKDPCQNISAYEMAQLQAYRWPDWQCWERINASFSISKTKEYFNNKKAQRQQKEKTENVLKKANKPESKSEIIWKVATQLKAKEDDDKRKVFWLAIYWKDVEYRSDFSFDLNSDFEAIYKSNMTQFAQAQENAIASDISGLFPKWKWLLESVDDVIKKADDADKTDWLESDLQKIEDRQCK